MNEVTPIQPPGAADETDPAMHKDVRLMDRDELCGVIGQLRVAIIERAFASDLLLFIGVDDTQERMRARELLSCGGKYEVILRTPSVNGDLDDCGGAVIGEKE